ILIFVYSRKETNKIARVIGDIYLEEDTFEAYLKEDSTLQEVRRIEIK
ncbi:unnamed protein product, partial [Rotaria sp. Silwood2]